MVEAHGQDGVAGLEQCLVHRQVGVGAGMGLDVGVLGPEQGFDPVPGQVLHLVDDLVPAVVAPARISLGVLVGEHRPRRRQHGRRREVLRRDELQGRRLAVDLGAEQRRGPRGRRRATRRRGTTPGRRRQSRRSSRSSLARLEHASSTVISSTRCSWRPRRLAPEVVDIVPELGQVGREELLQEGAGVVGADRDTHGRSIPRPLRRPGGSPNPKATLGAVPLDPRTPVLVGVGQVTERPDPEVPLTRTGRAGRAHGEGPASPPARTAAPGRRAGPAGRGRSRSG